MFLKSLTLTNVRIFKHADFTFRPGMNLIVGINGVGKSTILDTLCILLSQSLTNLAQSRRKSLDFEITDITLNQTALTAEITFEIPGTEFHYLVHQPSETYTANPNTSGQVRNQASTAVERHVLNVKMTSLKQSSQTPLAVYFSPRRALANISAKYRTNGKNAAFADALDHRELRLIEFADWWLAQTALAAENDPNAQRHLDALNAAIIQMIETCANVHAHRETFSPQDKNGKITPKTTTTLLIEKAGQTFDLGQLSDGERGILALVLDLARRLSQANPNLDDPLQGQAVVLIDELDLHLHPKWQRTIVQKLTTTFPNCQFIATTHSPLIIGEVEPENIILIAEDGEIIHPNQSLGMDTDGTILKIADLVDDDPTKRDKVATALKDPAHKNNRDRVDLIIALGMAKEGFDWIWCEHALTIGYRSSLTEIIQIIGRATRDAPGKTRARFTNLIAEPDASEAAVTEAVNDTLKAIAASLLMEQVLAPRFDFKPKRPDNQPTPGFDYGEGGYDPLKCNVGVNPETGQIQLEIKGLAEPKSPEADRICHEDLTELVTAFVQDKQTIERGLFDEELVPEELTQVRMGKIVKEKFPNLEEEDQEAVRQHAIAALNLVQQAKKTVNEKGGEYSTAPGATNPGNSEATKNTALIDGVRQFALSVTELDMDLIDRINPFGEAYAILAKSMSEERLRQVAEVIAAKRITLSVEEARKLAKRALRFKQEKGRLPSLTAIDPWEKRMAEGVWNSSLIF